MNLEDYEAARRRFRQQVGRNPSSLAELRSRMLLEDLQRRYNLANPEDEDRQPPRPLFLRNRRRPWK
jgi:hypothetical protein